MNESMNYLDHRLCISLMYALLLLIIEAWSKPYQNIYVFIGVPVSKQIEVSC